ncbi:MAG: outer membrane beta-barrel protein [Candidatus Acidiferrales bacterium]
MKKFMWVALAAALFVIPSHAQSVTPAADVSAGYSYLRVGGSNGLNMNGGSGAVTFNANNWLGLAADFGFYHASPSGVGVSASTYQFGPRVSYRAGGKVVPFGEALFGGAHLSSSGIATNPFAYTMGGGADLQLGASDKWSLRPEFAYVGMRQNGASENCMRISFGIVFHLGQK